MMTYIKCGLCDFRAISDHLKVINFQKFPGAAPPDPRSSGLRPEKQLLQIAFRKHGMYYNLYQFCTGVS